MISYIVMKTLISTKGQVVLPAEFRRQDRIRPGEQFEIERLGSGQYLLTKQTASGKSGVTDWLLSCPERGWFRPLSSESTNEI